MKAYVTKTFGWCYDGRTPTMIEEGTEVESPIAENAIQMGCAIDVAELDAAQAKAEAEAPKNKAVTNRKVK